jgi:alkylation response protein AidB-like acyl-CoA dehydrogenase
MTSYNPPLKDMAFVLSHVVGLSRLEKAADLDAATIDAVLEEAGKLARDVLAPINQGGDKAGNILKDGVVTTASGFKDAYAQYRDGGWNAVPFNPDHGGQGLPWALAFAVQEMWQGANMSFGLCPLLNQGAVEAIETHGSDEQKAFYLEKLISGEWTGTMNLTEPQAGSDLAAVRTKAERRDDGTYRISGQKIFITYGEHDFAENIIHLVLARLPDAPEGVKGISLFIVPKFLADGTRNDVVCTGIEHKLGIHASPTCTMQFGDKGNAVGTLIGRENEGIKYMFTMMNNARLSVGLQGVAIAERAYQKALSYARDRVQGKGLDGGGDRVAIIHHPDIARMLLSMKANIEAARALTYEAALASDFARSGDKAAQAKVDLLTPVVKAWSTDMAVDVTSTGIQIHGGMGFIEETGAAQYYRDARILPIYEGTNGIQANDLVFRKILRDGGVSAQSWFAEIKSLDLGSAFTALETATQWILDTGKAGDLNAVAAVAVPYLKAFSIVSCAAMMKRSVNALAQSGFDDDFCKAKAVTAAFYMTHMLPMATAYAAIVTGGSSSVIITEAVHL